MKKILGISAFYHDSAACLVIGGQVIAAAQEERFNRKKHCSDFPVESIRFCLQEGNLNIDELDAVVYYDKPLLKFERLIESYYAFAPKGLISFLKAIPVWINEKLFLKNNIYRGLKEIEEYDKKNLKLLFTEHHLSHAASSFYPSPYQESAVLTIDGVGEWCTASIGLGKGEKIEFLKELHFPHSVGLLYSAFTYYLGFKVNSGEYKLMGLAPYGKPNDPETLKYIEQIKQNLVDLKEDGSIWMNQKFFSYATSLRMIPGKKWEKLFGLKRRKPESELLQSHCNMAFAIQEVCEEIVLKMAQEAKKATGSENLCLAGGVALNCVANGKLLKAGIFNNIYIQPAAGDAGGSLGAALAISHLYFKEKRTLNSSSDALHGSYLGPEYSDDRIKGLKQKYGASYRQVENEGELLSITANQLGKGKVIGWFQGKMEFGPRALGNRSILGDARNAEMQQTINLKIKYRESFRPFAPAVLSEKASQYFELEVDSPYMLLVAPVQESLREKLPDNYYDLPLMERLRQKRSQVQAITHLDFSARVQTVHKETNPRFWNLIHAFEQQNGEAILINTSFNVRGEPIVCTPEDAYRCFMSTEMDILVIGNFIFEKEEQADWEDTSKWRKNFKMD